MINKQSYELLKYLRKIKVTVKFTIKNKTEYAEIISKYSSMIVKSDKYSTSETGASKLYLLFDNLYFIYDRHMPSYEEFITNSFGLYKSDDIDSRRQYLKNRREFVSLHKVFTQGQINDIVKIIDR